MKEEQLSASGSNRQYFRLTDNEGNTCIRVQGTSLQENKAFLYMARHFHERGLNVPAILSVSEDGMSYTQQDLGSTLLYDYIAEGRKTGVFCEREKQMLRRTIRALVRFQIEGARGMDWQQCYPLAEFNSRSISWDLNYFKYCFLKATGLEYREDLLENEFERMSHILLEQSMDAFMYRDMQSRNVMIYQDQPYFIDFQGGRRGPVYYDVASFLWQAKANFHPELREELIGEYLDELKQYISIDESDFHRRLRHFVLFRTMQVLGAYGFRGYFEKKPHFLQSIPYAIENLRQLLRDQTDEYPYLTEVLRQMTEMKQFQGIAEKKPLVVRIYSFSYKKGIPVDISGNGGGFVFDCRAVNNPGKYERYQGLTGLDQPVIKFLEEDGEIFPFLSAAYSLVDASVKRYMDRGFQHLMISFGCTGGQHRSVFAAERMAEHLNEKFGVEVSLIHREQNLERTLPPR